MSAYDEAKAELKAAPRTWVITGVAGFIGSNLLEALLDLNQRVVGVDNFSTGHARNLEQVQARVGPERWNLSRFIRADLADPEVCAPLANGADFILHQAALGSVPRSIAEPLETHKHNVTAFMNLLVAAREAGVKRFVFASSSAVYGDEPGLPKVESKIGRALSPYAATKAIDELYADAFARTYGFPSIGLRYFNVFGPRQDPEGAYAAVIPKWISALLNGQPVFINGDGETSRDFCFIADVVQANILAAAKAKPESGCEVCNVALGQRTTLNELFRLIQNALRRRDPSLPEQKPVYREFRAGDVRHSLADISKARDFLGYVPTHDIEGGLELAMQWYREMLG
jgi:UDP-N-acetylglucosamine 4-epimerase